MIGQCEHCGAAAPLDDEGVCDYCAATTCMTPAGYREPARQGDDIHFAWRHAWEPSTSPARWGRTHCADCGGPGPVDEAGICARCIGYTGPGVPSHCCQECGLALPLGEDGLCGRCSTGEHIMSAPRCEECGAPSRYLPEDGVCTTCSTTAVVNATWASRNPAAAGRVRRCEGCGQPCAVHDDHGRCITCSTTAAVRERRCEGCGRRDGHLNEDGVCSACASTRTYRAMSAVSRVIGWARRR